MVSPLWFSQIAHVPTDVARLFRLHTLDLRANKLTTLPLSLAQCSNLRLLDCTDNPLVPPLAAAANTAVGRHAERRKHPLPLLALLAAG